MGFLDRFSGRASAPRESTAPAQRAAGGAAPDDLFVPVPDADGWYGRRFRTPAGVEECEANLKVLLLAGGGEDRVFAARWTGSPPPPDSLFGIRDTAYGVVYVAIWQSGSMVSGQREVMVVPTRFDQRAPMPLAGEWKLRDSGLASIGHVTEFPVARAS